MKYIFFIGFFLCATGANAKEIILFPNDRDSNLVGKIITPTQFGLVKGDTLWIICPRQDLTRVEVDFIDKYKNTHPCTPTYYHGQRRFLIDIATPDGTYMMKMERNLQEEYGMTSEREDRDEDAFITAFFVILILIFFIFGLGSSLK